MQQRTRRFLSSLLFGLLGLLLLPAAANAWWDGQWSQRKQITIDTSATGANITDPIGTMPVLVRLHVGNFNFAAAQENGADLRFVAGDDKTPLKHHIESYDSLLGEAFVWVNVPNIGAGAQTSFWVYFGNDAATAVEDAKGTFDADTVLAWHFTERGLPVRDYTTWGHNATTAGLTADGALIGSGLRLDGHSTVSLPASPSLAWTNNGVMTWSAWVKMAAPQPNAVIFSRRAGVAAFLIGVNNGVPFVEVGDTFGLQRSVPVNGATLQPGSWHHVAVVANPQQITLYMDGNAYATLNTTLPALNSAALLGGDSAPVPVAAAPVAAPVENGTEPQPDAGQGAAATVADANAAAEPAPVAPASAYANFIGELDEFRIDKVARSAGFIKAAAISQGMQGASFLVFSVGEETAGWDTGHFGVIVKSVTLDAWIVIVILAVMAVIAFAVMADKTSYVNRQVKANLQFLTLFRELTSDLTVLDQKLASRANQLSAAERKMMRNSSLYRLYHSGVEEIVRRFGANGPIALSTESIAAIRAALDTGMIRESQKLNRMIVVLTIAISGGPFLGLLGTVIGVMITFGAIAASGDVNVNAIAPGIAAALLATVAGLAVAIPALFGYNYLTVRIKDVTADMHVFIDEFVTRTAEAYSGNTGHHPRQPLAAE